MTILATKDDHLVAICRIIGRLSIDGDRLWRIASLHEDHGVTPDERRSRIAELVMDRGRQSVERLAECFAVSPETIRRDLARLSEEGRVRKVHGGAQKAALHTEGSFDERMAEDAPAKAAIAARLRDVVRPGETLFIDTGSTARAALG